METYGKRDRILKAQSVLLERKFSLLGFHNIDVFCDEKGNLNMLTDAVFFSLDIENVNLQDEKELNSSINSLFSKNIKITDSTIRKQFIKIMKEKLNKSARIIFDKKVYFLENIPPKYAAICKGKTIFNYSQKDKVPDSIRGIIENKNGSLKFAEFPCNRKTKGGINIDHLPCYDNYKRIILVLESPHKDEYKECKLPAQGTTGKQICAKLEQKLSELVNNKDIHLAVGTFIVILVNPVQYPASCYEFLYKHTKPKKWSNKNITHRVFEMLFSNEGANLREDFKVRLKKYYRGKDDVIINCATKLNKAIVKDAIEEVMTDVLPNPTEKIVDLTHPSHWVYEKKEKLKIRRNR